MKDVVAGALCLFGTCLAFLVGCLVIGYCIGQDGEGNKRTTGLQKDPPRHKDQAVYKAREKDGCKVGVEIRFANVGNKPSGNYYGRGNCRSDINVSRDDDCYYSDSEEDSNSNVC